MFGMRRREFIALLCGAAASPLAARAQQIAKVYRLGWFFSSVPLAEMAGLDPIDPVGRVLLWSLRDLGYVEGENLVVERRSAEGRFDRIDEIATELVGRKPDAIVTGGGEFLAQALQRVTKSVPIVSPAGYDPVGTGLVASLSHPGGNVTGFVEYPGPEFEAKRLELLKEAVPQAVRIAYLGMKDVWEGPAAQAVRDAAAVLGVTLIHVEHTPNNYAGAFALMARDRSDALYVAYHPSNYANRQLIADFSVGQRVPGIYPYRQVVTAGGLMCYGASQTDLWRRAAGVVDKIFKGAKPADIPIERPTKLELVINLKTAKTLGLPIPRTLLALADEVIE